MLPPPLSLEEAQARLLALAPRLPTEHVDITGAIGRYLAEPLLARRTQPATDCSAMDGYAVCADDIAGPWTIVGESAAGHPYQGLLAPGQAVRISTGAVMPEGGAAVILQEDIAHAGETLRLTGTPPSPPYRHIRRRGMDFASGEEISPRGVKIGPALAALALAAGHKHLPVTRRLRIAVIDSGDELAADPECCLPHQTPATNGAMLEAMIAASLPADVTRIGPVNDDLDSLLAAFDRANEVDVIVTSGGASVGDHDLMRPALENWGASIDFWRVAIKPGKPLLIATRPIGPRQQLIVGLPGNPVSGYVTAYLFLLPLLRAMSACGQPLPRPVSATAGVPMPANGARRVFLRGTWNGESVVLAPNQDSAALTSLAASNVLIDRPAHAPAITVGEPLRVFQLPNGGIA